MSIKTIIPTYLQPSTNDMETVEVEGKTVGECLCYLTTQFPGIEKMLFAEDGNLHNYVGIFVNGNDAFPEELAKPIGDGDELHILYIIEGG